MVHIGLFNPKTPSNMGSIVRAASCFDAQGIYYTGNRYDHAARFQTDPQNKTMSIPLQHVECLTANPPPGSNIVCIEFALGATALPNFEHPANAYYLFGPEDGSLTQQHINAAHAVVYIPTQRCLNLAAAVNVVLYDRIAKQQPQQSDDANIIANRDGNNRLKLATHQQHE